MRKNWKILLVTSTVKDKNPYLEKPFPAPSLGLWRLKGFLESYGHEVTICDTNIEKLSDFPITRYNLVGISVLHATMLNDLTNLHYVKTKNENAITVIGGHEATFNYKKLLEYPQLDFVVLGEGEYPLLHLTQGLISKGVASKLGCLPSEPLSNHDFVNFTKGIDYEQIPYRKYWAEHSDSIIYRCARLYTSNRCSYKCSFCTACKFVSGKIVSLSAEDIVEIINRLIYVHNPKSVFIQDDNFTLNEQRVLEFCKLVRKEKIDLRFLCQTRVDKITRNMARAMKSVGFGLVGLGVESFSQRQLAEFRKGFTVDVAKKTIEMLLEEGITPFINTILSSQNTTMQDVEKTLTELLKYSAKCEIGINLFTYPYAGSLLQQDTRLLVSRHIIPENFVYEHSEIIIPNDDAVYLYLLNLEKKVNEKWINLKDAEKRSNNYSQLLLEVFKENFEGKHF